MKKSYCLLQKLSLGMTFLVIQCIGFGANFDVLSTEVSITQRTVV